MNLSRALLFPLVSLIAVNLGLAQTSPTPFPLGGSDFQNWSGSALIPLPGKAVFQVPDGPKGFHKHGFRSENDSTADWQFYAGLEVVVNLNDDSPVELKTSLAGTQDSEGEMVSSVTTIQGIGSHLVTLPWRLFAFDQANMLFLQSLKRVEVSVRSLDGKSNQVEIKEIHAMKGFPIALECPVRGKSAMPNQTVEYQVTVSNCSQAKQVVNLNLVKHGWEAMTCSVEPASMILAPGESQACSVHVTIPEQIAPGGHEEQTLQAVADGNGANATTMTFTTAHGLEHPYILATATRWKEIREIVKKYPWAQAAQAEYVKAAEEWEAPEISKPPQNDSDDTMGPFLFPTTIEHGFMACGISWQLTGDKRYAEKVATFLSRLSDPQNGYAKTFRACNQGFVQEGHFFQHIAMAYDMILDSGVLSPADCDQINTALRLALETFDRGNSGGSINNWNLSELCGAFYSSLAMGDLERANRFFEGPSGIKDQLAKGAMDDGWWYECSVSYNTWCTSEFSQVAIAWQPWGVNFKDMQVPASYYRDAALSSASGKAQINGGAPAGSINQMARPFGMCKEIWGPHTKPYRQIHDMWNSLLPFLDYRGVMFGINDTTEKRPADQDEAFDMAYYLYRDPNLAAVASKAKHRSLLYAVPDDAVAPEPSPHLVSYADNSGVALISSQAAGRDISQQIRAAIHYGTHGWAHGHFDRTDLLSIMRYGRSFYSPEMLWYSYEPFMYKFYVQTSLNHNMVVVDQKMQEPVESQRLLFYPGKALQAVAVQTQARWSNPPYGGMVYDYVPVKTFAEKCWREGRSVPIPDKLPAYGTLTDYTEPVLQRRLMVVTDDYVVVADYLKATASHTFDNVLQLTGFQSLNAPEKTYLRHDTQWNPDPVSSAQFVTDCDWYSVKAPALAKFQMNWKSDPDPKKAIAPTLCSEDGALKLDIHSLWPQDQQIMIGQAPENQGNEKQVWYTVKADGKTLVDDKFGSWILGQANIDLPIDGTKSLDLETVVKSAKKNTLFWSNARIVTADGKEIPLSQLSIKFQNILQPPQPNQDYYGGPIKIVGTAYSAATPAEPQDLKLPGTVQIDLTGVQAVRFKATLGGAFPLGNVSQLHKVYVERTQGTEARFLTLIEPYESNSQIKSVQADGADKIRVQLIDGRTQELTINNLEGSGKDITVHLVETKDGTVTREESSSTQN